MKMMMKRAGAGDAERQPHHAAARCRRRRRRRDAHRVPRGAELAVRHGAGRQRLLRRQHRCGRALPLLAAARRGSRRAPTKVADLPAGPLNHHWTKNIIASRDGTQALRDGRLEQQRRRERHGRRRKAAPRSGRSTCDAADARDCSRPACAIPNGMAWEPRSRRAVDGGERARRARQRPRARLPDVGAATAASTAGRTATTASTSTRASSRRGPTWSPRRSRPTTRSGRTRRRSA